MPRTILIFKQYSDHLLDYLNHSYFTPLSYKDQLQTLEQVQIVESIREIIKNMDLIIRLTDKGNHFYIGLASELEKSKNFSGIPMLSWNYLTIHSMKY
jgi:hypothetical protein